MAHHDNAAECVISLVDRIDPLQEETTMKCPKCRGRMYAEKYYDFVRSFDAWKCCSCGEVVDPTILANRARNNNVFIG